MVQEGRFREDLFFRINVFSFRLPPLRERNEDIPLLAKHLLRQIKPGATLSPQTLAALTAHQWPGNVRELKNAIEAASALSSGVIEPEHLNTGIGLPFDLSPSDLRMSGPGGPGLDARLAALEKGLILDALTKAGGIQVRAAELLGIKERSLWHRIAKHQIDVSSLRNEKNGNGAGPEPQEAKP